MSAGLDTSCRTQLLSGRAGSPGAGRRAEGHQSSQAQAARAAQLHLPGEGIASLSAFSELALSPFCKVSDRVEQLID